MQKRRINMSTANMSGSDYTVPPNVTASGAKNVGGSATKLGSDSSLLDNVSVARAQSDVFGSTVVDGDDTDEALSASVIAYNNQRPIAMRLTTEISGQSNTFLRSGANVPGQLRSINKRESFKVSRIATAIRAGYWNIYSGTWSTPPTSATESPGNDVAASPTRSAPGDLVFRTGQPLPVRNQDYKPKTG